MRSIQLGIFFLCFVGLLQPLARAQCPPLETPGASLPADATVEVLDIQFLREGDGLPSHFFVDYQVTNFSGENPAVTGQLGVQVRNISLGAGQPRARAKGCFQLGTFTPGPSKVYRERFKFKVPESIPVFDLPYEGTYTFSFEVALSDGSVARKDLVLSNNLASRSTDYRMRLIPTSLGLTKVPGGVDLETTIRNAGLRPTSELEVRLFARNVQQIKSIDTGLEAGRDLRIKSRFPNVEGDAYLSVKDKETGSMLLQFPVIEDGDSTSTQCEGEGITEVVLEEEDDNDNDNNDGDNSDDSESDDDKDPDSNSDEDNVLVVELCDEGDEECAGDEGDSGDGEEGDGGDEDFDPNHPHLVLQAPQIEELEPGVFLISVGVENVGGGRSLSPAPVAWTLADTPTTPSEASADCEPTLIEPTEGIDQQLFGNVTDVVQTELEVLEGCPAEKVHLEVVVSYEGDLTPDPKEASRSIDVFLGEKEDEDSDDDDDDGDGDGDGDQDDDQGDDEDANQPLNLEPLEAEVVSALVSAGEAPTQRPVVTVAVEYRYPGDDEFVLDRLRLNVDEAGFELVGASSPEEVRLGGDHGSAGAVYFFLQVEPKFLQVEPKQLPRYLDANEKLHATLDFRANRGSRQENGFRRVEFGLSDIQPIEAKLGVEIGVARNQGSPLPEGAPIVDSFQAIAEGSEFPFQLIALNLGTIPLPVEGLSGNFEIDQGGSAQGSLGPLSGGETSAEVDAEEDIAKLEPGERWISVPVSIRVQCDSAGEGRFVLTGEVEGNVSALDKDGLFDHLEVREGDELSLPIVRRAGGGSAQPEGPASNESLERLREMYRDAKNNASEAYVKWTQAGGFQDKDRLRDEFDRWTREAEDIQAQIDALEAQEPEAPGSTDPSTWVDCKGNPVSIEPGRFVLGAKQVSILDGSDTDPTETGGQDPGGTDPKGPQPTANAETCEKCMSLVGSGAVPEYCCKCAKFAITPQGYELCGKVLGDDCELDSSGRLRCK